MEALQAELIQLQLKLARQEWDILEANYKIQARECQLADLEDKIASLDFAIHVCSKSLSTSADEISELNRKNQQLEQKIEQYERTIQSRDEEIARMTGKDEDLNLEHAKLRQQTLELEVQIQGLQEQLDEIREENGPGWQLKEVKDELALKVRNYNGLQKEYVDLERQLNVKNIEIFSLKRRLKIREAK